MVVSVTHLVHVETKDYLLLSIREKKGFALRYIKMGQVCNQIWLCCGREAVLSLATSKMMLINIYVTFLYVAKISMS